MFATNALKALRINNIIQKYVLYHSNAYLAEGIVDMGMTDKAKWGTQTIFYVDYISVTGLSESKWKTSLQNERPIASLVGSRQGGSGHRQTLC